MVRDRQDDGNRYANMTLPNILAEMQRWGRRVAKSLSPMNADSHFNWESDPTSGGGTGVRFFC